MSFRDSQWSNQANGATSMANRRVCLALLRIFRNVTLTIPPKDVDEIAAPFWPLIREHEATSKAAAELRIKNRQGFRRKQPSDEDAVVPSLLIDGPYPDDPESETLQAIGYAMIRGYPEFDELFGTLEAQLVERVASEALPSDGNIRTLSVSLGFSPVEEAFLSLASAVEQSSISTSLFRYPASGRTRVLALQHALGQPMPHDVHALMTLGSNLERSGLLEHNVTIHHDLEDSMVLSRKGAALMSLEIRTPQDMANVILKPLPSPKDTVPLDWPHLQEKMELVERLLANAVAHEATGINILFYGAPGTGKTEFAQQLVRKLGVKGFQILDTGDDHAPATRHERLASLVLSQIFAPARESVLVLDEAEDIFDTSYHHQPTFRSPKAETSKSWMNALLEKTRVPVIWISNRVGHMDPAYLRRFSYCLEFPAMPRAVRRKIARAYLEPAGVSGATIESLLGSEHVSPALLSSAARMISLSTDGTGSGAADIVARHVLTDNLKAMGHEFSTSVPARATRFDLAYLNVKGAVTPEAVLNGLQRMGKGTMLLGGPPGTGKTQFAAEIANRLGRELVYKTAADINSMWYGQSERNVAEMFTDCDPAKEVLFLDEADTLLGAREASGHRADKAVTAEFLRRVEAFEGIFVCATNHSKEFDAAMMRRFVYRLTFLALNADQRMNLFLECAMGWNPAAGAPPQALDPALFMRLGDLDQVTAGDFANVVKRVRALQLELSPHAWIEELQAEQDAKPQTSGNRIGFI